MSKASISELKLELSNILLDLVGFEGDEYAPFIQKAKTMEDLDNLIELIIQKQNNSQFEKQLVMFWRKNRQ